MRNLAQALLRTKGVGVVLLCLKSQVATLHKTFGDEVAYLVFESRPAMRAAAKIGSLFRRKPICETIDRVPASFAHLHEEIGAQILHCPVQIYSLLDFNIPAVLHLHDLQHLHFPENFSEGDLQART